MMNFGKLAILATTALSWAVQEVSGNTIVDIAVADPDNFSTLVDLVVQAGLAETLADESAEFSKSNGRGECLNGIGLCSRHAQL